MSYKILVVDDEVDIRDLLSVFLENEGYEISTAVDGLDAFEKIKSFQPDLVISDIRMPRSNGFELLDRLKNLPSPPLPILFISGYAGMDFAPYNDNKNFVGFIAKPVKWDALLTSIQEVQKNSAYSIK